MKLLPLYIGDNGKLAQPCIRSGFCCKQAACSFGIWDENIQQCKFLQIKDGQYECGIASEIVTKPGWEISPAFGAGCCSPFNGDRQTILRKLAKQSNSNDGDLTLVTKSHL